jgi:hypothetical protein
VWLYGNATMSEIASEVAKSIKFSIAGEWVDASSDAPIDVISSSIECGSTEHGIAEPGRGPRLRGSACGVLPALYVLASEIGCGVPQ